MAGVRRMQSMARANLWDMISDERDAARAECERLRLALAVVVGTVRGDIKTGAGCPLCYGHYRGPGISIYIHEATCAYEQARDALDASGEENNHAIQESD
jgi:hypothetical protein